MKKLTILSFLFFLITVFTFAEESRNALLIANDKYPFGDLTNPVKEAKDLKKTLEKLGFTVALVENGNIDKMESAIEKFGALLNKNGGIGFFHYGGHAIQVNGKNYLIPANTQMSSENQIRRLSLDLDDLMKAMQAETNIVILDACRNNPLPSSTRSVATRGLVLSSVKPKNSIIVYSAEAGNVAQDGVFTPILTKKLLEQEELLEVLRDVRIEVYEKTNHAQMPKDDNGLIDKIYLAGHSASKPSSVASVPAWVEKIEPWSNIIKYKDAVKLFPTVRIPSGNSVLTIFVTGNDEYTLEKQADFECIYYLMDMLHVYFQHSVTENEAGKIVSEYVCSATSFGKASANVQILTSRDYVNETLEQRLVTPDGEYDIYDYDGNFRLSAQANSWINFAFHQGYPHLAQSLKKIDGYKKYSKGTSRWFYYALYSFEESAFATDLRTEMDKITE